MTSSGLSLQLLQTLHSCVLSHMAKLSLEKLELLIGKVVVSAALFQQTYLAFKLLDTLLRNCTSFEVSI